MNTRWTKLEDEPPQDNAVVDTIGPAGTQQRLKRRGSLWFFPDDSMYVYYTPVFWRPVEDPPVTR